VKVQFVNPVIYYSAHPFQKKEWYNVHVPTVFDVRTPTITPCNRTAGQSKYSNIVYIE
jgi:ribosomal protein S3AE